jgi:hypothetical protein
MSLVKVVDVVGWGVSAAIAAPGEIRTAPIAAAQSPVHRDDRFCTVMFIAVLRFDKASGRPFLLPR